MTSVRVEACDPMRAAGVAVWLESAGLTVVNDADAADVTVVEGPVPAGVGPVVAVLDVVGAGLVRTALTVPQIRAVVSWSSPEPVWGEAVRAAAAHGIYLCPYTVAEVALVEMRVGSRRANGRELTVRQRQVAELAADGLTNRQIAQRLGLSVHTVKTHVRDAVRTLDAADRHGLADRLKQAGGGGGRPAGR